MRVRSSRAEVALLTAAMSAVLAVLAIVPVGAQGPFGPSPEPPLSGQPGARPPQPPPLQPQQPVPQPGEACPLPTPCPTDPATPIVSLQVRVPASIAAGQDLEYRICVKNVSQAAAHHVIVRDPLPANARFVRAEPRPNQTDPEIIWNLGTLAGGACREIVLVLQATGDVRNCVRVQFEHGQCVCTSIAAPTLKLEKVGPTEAILYDSLNYCLKLTNTGSGTATNIHLVDRLPEGLEHESKRRELAWDLASLAPGETRCVEYQVVAKAAGRHCNRATATAAGGLAASAEHCVTVGEAKLNLNKVGPAQRFVGIPATYQLTVSNTGNMTINNVVINDPVPTGTSFVSASAGGRLEGNTVRWNIGTLTPGQSRTVDVELRAAASGRICNRATATADRGLNAQAEACTEFQGVTALHLEVVDLDDPVEVNEQTRYVIVVRNQGSDPATNLQISAVAPKEMSIVRVIGPADHVKEGQKVTYKPITLPARGEARYEVTILAQEPGDVRFRVQMTADQLKAGPVHEEESTNIYRDIPNRLPPMNGQPNPPRLNPPPEPPR